MSLVVVQAAAATQASRFRSSLRRPLEGVTNEAWVMFARALEVQTAGAVSASGGLGCYDMRARRLVELGYAKALPQERVGERQVQACEFLPPWTRARFLTDAAEQYLALRRSCALYDADLATGRLSRREGLSRAGTLALLHRGGRGALLAWPDMFKDTAALVGRCERIF